MRPLPLGVFLFGASLVLAPGLACKGASPPGGHDLPSTCPGTEPAASSSCEVPVGKSCTYVLPTSRDVHCHCIGTVWDCGTPMGIDTTAPAGTCPKTQPANGATCTLPAPPPSSGDRPGCLYSAAMTVTHDCVCAHYSHHAVWDCGQRSGTGPEDASGCPARKPLDDTLCLQPAALDCQYGYNLATTCNCKPRGGSESAWSCNTLAQPPSPR